MATRPLPEAAEPRYAPYIAELHEFFATSGVPFGSPDDVFLIADRLKEAGSFSEDLGSLVRSIVLRQGGAMPHAQLLEILSLAIAGPTLANAPQQYSEPLRHLLAFVSGVMRRPWNVPSSESAEVVPFPTDTSTRAAEPVVVEPRVSTFERIRGEQIRERHAEPPSRTISMPDAERQEPAAHEQIHPAAAGIDTAGPRRLTPLQRNLLLGAGGIMALAAALIFLLRPTPPAEVYQVGPAPTRAVAPSPVAKAKPTGPLFSTPIPTAVPGKPSAYGQGAAPMQQNRSTQSTANSQPAQPVAAQTASLPAGNPQPTASSDSPFPGSVTPADPSPVSPEISEAPAAPIIRRPSPGESNGSTAGDLSVGRGRSGQSAQPSHFGVSSGVMASYLLFAPNPQYPMLARVAHIQGQVILQAVVAKDGSVSTVRVLRGHRLLRKAAVEAVRRWRYRPYRLGGKPIDVATIVTVDFHK